MTFGRLFIILVFLSWGAPALAAEGCSQLSVVVPGVARYTSDVAQVAEHFIPKECAQVPVAGAKLDQANHDAGSGLGGLAERIGATEKLNDILNACETKLLESCFPHLKEQIPEDELRSIFDQAIKSPLYRMREPGAACFFRASLLSKELTERGYKVRMLNLRAPANNVVGLVRGSDGKPIGYYAYGNHWVVEVTQKSGSGPTRMILDPQFADSPMSLSDYFRRLTGEDCPEEKPASPAGCSYKLYPSNFTTPSNELDGGNYDFGLSCGLESGKGALLAIQKDIAQAPTPNGGGSEIPADLQAMDDPTPRLIQRSLISGERILKNKLKVTQLESKVSQAPQAGSAEDKSYRDGLANGQIKTFKQQMDEIRSQIDDIEKRLNR